MNAPITRRALLGATAAASVAALPALALAGLPETSEPDADAALIGLIEQHRKATAAWEAACRDLEAARDRAWAAYPPRPAALTATSADVMLHGLAPSGRARTPGGRALIYFNCDDLDRLRAGGPVMSMVLDEDGQSLRSVPNPAGEARRQQIVATYDEWLADRAAVNDSFGLTAAEAAEEPLCYVMEAAETAVEAHLPTTLVDVHRKAAWVLARSDRDDAMLLFLRQLAGDLAPPIADEVDDMQVAA